MADHSSNGILEGINSLILDTMVTVERAQDLAKSLQSSPDGTTPSLELASFAETLSKAAMRLRREGLHPNEQGRLL
jgi:hypothetical protein